mgnify:CR=1 FL=1
MPQSANDIDDLTPEIEELKSKTEIKKEMYQLQDFAQSLVEMSKHQRSLISLTDDLKDAMVVADKIKNKHEAMRRHIRHIAKILLETDLRPIHKAIEVMENKHQQSTAKFVRLETLRDELIEQGNEAVEAFLSEGYIEKNILAIILAISVKTISNYSNHVFDTEVDDMFESRFWSAS